MNPCLFLSTETYDPASAVIRWYTGCDWSHCGWMDLDTGAAFSAMALGGVRWRERWRECNARAKYLFLSAPKTPEALAKALTQEGDRYDFLNILGIATGRDWFEPGEFICDKLVLWAYREAGAPLLNHTFIPLEHMRPRDILLSSLVAEDKDKTCSAE